MKMKAFIGPKFIKDVDIDLKNFNERVHAVFNTNTFVFANIPREIQKTQKITNFKDLDLFGILEQDVLIISNYNNSKFLIRDLYQMYKQISRKNLHYLVEYQT